MTEFCIMLAVGGLIFVALIIEWVRTGKDPLAGPEEPPPPWIMDDWD